MAVGAGLAPAPCELTVRSSTFKLPDNEIVLI